MMRKIIITMTRPEEMWYLHKNKYVLKLKRIQRIATTMVPDLEDNVWGKKKEMHLTTLKQRRERGDLTTIYKLVNNLEETNRKDLILKRKGEARYMRGQEKIVIRI